MHSSSTEILHLMMHLDFDFYSPEEQLITLNTEKANVSLFIKRDDLIHPYISGNKWRKLKYILQMAFEEQKSELVTFGGAWSNHLLATACAGAKFKFKTIGYVRGEVVQNPVLNLCKLFGMELKFVDRTSYKNKYELFLKHHDDSESMFIDEGGQSAEGVKGCSEIISELTKQYDHIFVAAGTGTTSAGLLNGIIKNQLPAKLHIIPVIKAEGYIKNQIEHLSKPNEQLIIHENYHFGGYARSSPELITFIKAFVAETGLMIEPIYTGKVFYAVFDLIKKNYFQNEDKILLIHTGGLTGLLGQFDKF